MYCPKCKSEYIEEITFCKDCKVALVKKEELGEDVIEYLDLFPVYSPPDASLLAIAKSLLEAEEIQYWVQNEKLQDLYGFGQIIGFNQIFGSPEIYVKQEDLDTAKELLSELEVVDKSVELE